MVIQRGLPLDRIRLTGRPRTPPGQHGKNRVDSGSSPVKRRVQIISRAAAAVRATEQQQMAKPTTIKIRLNSTADTGHFYVTKKNARTMTEKMTVRKYDPVARKHVEYKEGKIK